MADLVQTPADVKLKGKTVTIIIVQVGEIVTAVQPLYRNTTDSKYWLGDNNSSEETATVAGISATGAAADGYVVMVQKGPMDIGATLAAGMTYILSATAGKIAPVADLAAGNYLTRLGHASDTSTLQVDIGVTGVTK